MANTDPIDHDANFKRLLTTFFHEFVALFLPQLSAYIDLNTPVEFLNAEIVTDLTSGEKRAVDLIAKVRFREEDAFFLVHIENQATARSNFPRRMFRYFTRLHDKYNLPVYPIALFSYDAPQRVEPQGYTVAFPDTPVLQYRYRSIQLNRLSWRRFVKQPNPVAAALMAKMKIAPKDRPKVKLECLRLLATLKLDPARSQLIGDFVDTYLQLTADEMRRYERAFAGLAEPEKEANMEMMSSWTRQGRHEGKEELLAVLIRHRFGSVEQPVMTRLHQLSLDQLNELGAALLDFQTPADLETWLARHTAQ
jgi:predicted transposase YdaD